MEEKSIGHALQCYSRAAKVAKAFQVAHGVALGCAAASLIVGGLRAVRKLRGAGE